MGMGKRIKEIRLAKKMTQKELANRAKLATVTIRKYENDERTPGTEQVRSIAEALNVDPFELLGWERFDEQYPNLGEEEKQFQAMEAFLESLGYSVSIDKVWQSENGYYKEEILDGEVIGQSWIPDEERCSITVRKAGIESEFSEDEFQAFQAEIKQSVEFQLWKKAQSK